MDWGTDFEPGDVECARAGRLEQCSGHCGCNLDLIVWCANEVDSVVVVGDEKRSFTDTESPYNEATTDPRGEIPDRNSAAFDNEHFRDGWGSRVFEMTDIRPEKVRIGGGERTVRGIGDSAQNSG